MNRREIEDSIKACYSTWSDNYYDSYYGIDAPYPPVHRDLMVRLLRKANIKNVLDAGCGPASFLRELVNEKMDLFGFDLTPEMVVEARKVLAAHGVAGNHVWEGSVLSPESFQSPDLKPKRFDAAVCVGVLPHIPPQADTEVIANLHGAVKKNGLVILEARNQFFALFTLNRYSHQFFSDELLRVDKLRKKAGKHLAQVDEALEKIQSQFRMDMPPVRKGKVDEPGYDEVLSRTHNPLVLKEQFEAAGFRDVQLYFYHYHALPPSYGTQVAEFFRVESVAMESDPQDWRGYFMASAFLLTGRKM
jgi:SAM-dependent methyltransferase